jgi:DNA mismatch repair protein MutH
MAHYLTGDEKYRDLIYDDDCRSYLIARAQAPSGYRFGRMQQKRARVQARSALRRLNGYFKSMVEAIANSKLRRMERELELRGIRLDRTSNSWVMRKSRPRERS